MAVFDSMRAAIHDTTTAVFGELCAWTPTAGGAEQTAQVNFQRPDSLDSLGDYAATAHEYLAWDTRMEYRTPQFPTLKASVDSGTREIVTINAVTYRVTKVYRVHDGATFFAKLEATA